jgi:ligand-binding sensor domain-containing protein
MKEHPKDPEHKCRRYRPRFPEWLLIARVLFVLLSFDGCLHTVLADAIPIWAAYSPENSDIPSAVVYALAQSRDGAIWVGTDRGLGRLDKEGHWQTYTKANTNGGLPADSVVALAQSLGGTLWVRNL